MGFSTEAGNWLFDDFSVKIFRQVEYLIFTGRRKISIPLRLHRDVKLVAHALELEMYLSFSVKNKTI